MEFPSRMENGMEFINPWLALLGLLLPLVVARVTRSTASSTVKGWTLAALSGVGAVIAELAESGLDFTSADWREVLNNLALIFGSSVLAYKGGLVKAPAQSIALKTASSGIGQRRDEHGRFAA